MGRSSEVETKAKQAFLDLELVLRGIDAGNFRIYALKLFVELNTINKSMLKIRGKENVGRSELLSMLSASSQLSQSLNDYQDPYREVSFCPSWGALKMDYWDICFASYYPSNDEVDSLVDSANVKKLLDGYQKVLKDFAGFVKISKDPTAEAVRSTLSNLNVTIKSYREILKGILSANSTLS